MNKRRNFKRWLYHQPHGTVVGFAGNAYTNPIANWIDDQHQEDDLFVFGVQNSVFRDGAFIRDLEPWEEALMSAADQLYPGAPITRETTEAWLKQEEQSAKKAYRAA